MTKRKKSLRQLAEMEDLRAVIAHGRELEKEIAKQRRMKRKQKLSQRDS